MGTVWTMIVPILVIMVMRKAFKALGLGDLMNPISALGLATGGAGKMMGDKGDSLNFAKGLGAGAKSTASSAYRGLGKSAKWAAGDSKSREMTRKFNKGLRRAATGGAKGVVAGIGGAAALATRQDKRAELAKKLKTSAANARANANAALGAASIAARSMVGATKGAVGGQRDQIRKDFASGSSMAGSVLTKPFRGASNVLGAKWRSSAKARGKALTAGEHMLSVMASAGVKVLGEGNPDLKQALETWKKKLDPSAPEKISRQYDRELTTRTARMYDDELISLETARIGKERSDALAIAMLGRDFNTEGSLSLRSTDALAHSYAQVHNVPRQHVMVDPTTGFAFLSPAGDNRIPVTKDPAVLDAYARSPLTWLSPAITARKDGEGDGEYAFRMRATLERAGLIDSSGATVDMVEKLKLEPGPELNEQLYALASGGKSELSDRVGVVDPSDQALRDIAAVVRHNYTEIDGPAKQAAVVVELQHEMAQVRVDMPEIDADIATAKGLTATLGAELAQAGTPMDLRVSVDKFEDSLKDTFRDVLGKLADQMVSVYSANATAGSEPSEMLAMLPSLDSFQDKLTADMEKLSDEFGNQFHGLRNAPGPGDARKLAEQMEAWLEKTTEKLRGELDVELENTTRKLREQADRHAQLSNTYGNGVARPSNFANGSEPPTLTVAA